MLHVYKPFSIASCTSNSDNAFEWNKKYVPHALILSEKLLFWCNCEPISYIRSCCVRQITDIELLPLQKYLYWWSYITVRKSVKCPSEIKIVEIVKCLGGVTLNHGNGQLTCLNWWKCQRAAITNMKVGFSRWIQSREGGFHVKQLFKVVHNS